MPAISMEYPGYEAVLPWHHRQPFDGAEQFPCVIRPWDARYLSWAPEPGNAMATWVYVGTRRLNQGTFYVEPGHWFDAGNHPNPEPYYVLRGSLRLSNPDTSGHLDDLRSWPPPTSTKGPADMQSLPRSTWLHFLHGTDPRLTVLVSFFYCDEQIRCGKVTLPAGRESQPESGPWEKTFHVEAGSLSVNLTGTGRSLLAGPGDLVFLPPSTEHSLQAIGDDRVTALFAEALGWSTGLHS